MMAWYASAIAEYPKGLVSQAQASAMLGISRMAVSRLVWRGYLRAVYFPKPPDVLGVAVGADDPSWVKIMGWLGGKDAGYTFPTASYVAFEDVIALWQSGEARKKCRRDWNEIMANLLPKERRLARENEISVTHRATAESERSTRKCKDRGES